eukprot:TRINITY_DN369_c0_g1_i1.p1 TRINITY_DN369_c0_g1~~TRINITY_DN369_c0_g1_i1.p1  ORF type:complete len:236 (+),score=32.81 TRINITY_DN369_c0_g1_i1:46-708(+)
MVLVPGSGFGGSGYKFDKAEEEAIKKDRKQQRKQYSAAVGMEDEVSSSESGEESEADEEGATPAGIVPPKEVDKEKFEKILEDDRSTKSQKEAAQQALAFIKALELKKQLQHVKPPGDPDHFSIEMEINDFSQQARWKVTNKETINQITEWYNVAVTTRGTFVPPGRNPLPGERKLHLIIEGSTEIGVKRAKRELKKMLKEAESGARPGTTTTYGKYHVL